MWSIPGHDTMETLWSSGIKIQILEKTPKYWKKVGVGKENKASFVQV